MSRADLARAAGIHEVMPRRYEEPECGEFARPRPETTWLALNRALGYEIPDDLVQDLSAISEAKKNGMFYSGPLQDEDAPLYSANQEPFLEKLNPPDAIANDSTLLLKDASLEDIVRLLHSKNIEPTFRHLLT